MTIDADAEQHDEPSEVGPYRRTRKCSPDCFSRYRWSRSHSCRPTPTKPRSCGACRSSTGTCCCGSSSRRSSPAARTSSSPGRGEGGRERAAPTILADGTGVNGVELAVVIFFFVLVTVGGFWAARWRRAGELHSLDEWGLGGRGFGTVITWFLLGGDLYTAYTFVAVPAALYATGAVSGFFAVPYTIIAYPIIFIFMPRIWSVAHRHGYVTPADFVRGRYDSRGLALAVAVTGILATMPYIALQLVGIQAVVTTMGLGGTGSTFAKDLPLIIAFAVLAAYTYSSGLRAPAIIAFVKDTLIYIVIVVAIIYVATKIGFGTMFDSAKAQMAKTSPVTGKPRRVHHEQRELLGVRHARVRFGPGTVHVSALDDGGAVGTQPQRDPPQRGDPARCTR